MKIIACSVTVDTETTLHSFELFNSERTIIKQFVGIHPEFAKSESIEKFLEIFRINLENIDGIGEIGLDITYAKDDESYKRQKQVFSAMLELAQATNRPVSIHSRKSLDDILDILPSFRLKSALLHWFAGSKKQLAKSMDMGLYVSYGPTLVYSRDKQVLLKRTDKDKFLAETDGPVRYSRCFGNIPANSSSCLVSVISSFARILELSYQETVQMLETNSLCYLGGKN
jgi:TatD DNase family protein